MAGLASTYRVNRNPSVSSASEMPTKSISTVGAVKWISVVEQGGPATLVVEPESSDVLRPLGNDVPVNMLSIFGAARGGKSFLMNQLSRRTDVFRISNAKDPCTSGIDLSRSVLSLGEFKEGRVDNSGPKVILADVEGQGDRDVKHDAKLASTILPLSKCVLFNWKDSLQVDKILNQLGVMQHSACNVDMEAEGVSDDGIPRCFGHLHIIFRDWNYTGTPEEVKRDLLGRERRVLGADAAIKDAIRTTLTNAFESITVWLLPPPVEQTSDLSKELKKEDLSPLFRKRLEELRSTLAAQLATPTYFGGRVITGHTLDNIVAVFAKTLNSDGVILPESAYTQMLVMEAENLRKIYCERAKELFEKAKEYIEDNILSNVDLEEEIQEASTSLMEQYKNSLILKAKGGYSPDIIDHFDAILRGGKAEIILINTKLLDSRRRDALQNAKSKFDADFWGSIRTSINCTASEIEAKGRIFAKEAKDTVEIVPPAREGDNNESLRIIKEHCDKAISEAIRDNRELEIARENAEQALEEAKEIFSRNLDEALEPYRSGMPYMFSEAETALNLAFQTALFSMREFVGQKKDLESRLTDYSKIGHATISAEYASHRAIAIANANIEAQKVLKEGAELHKLRQRLPLSERDLVEGWQPVVAAAMNARERALLGWTISPSDARASEEHVKQYSGYEWNLLQEQNMRAIDHINAQTQVQRLNEELAMQAQRTDQAHAATIEARNELNVATNARMDAEIRAKAATNAAERNAAAAQIAEAAAREQEARARAAEAHAEMLAISAKAEALQLSSSMEVDEDSMRGPVYKRNKAEPSSPTGRYKRTKPRQSDISDVPEQVHSASDKVDSAREDVRAQVAARALAHKRRSSVGPRKSIKDIKETPEQARARERKEERIRARERAQKWAQAGGAKEV